MVTARVNGAAKFTKPPTSSTRCPRAHRAEPRATLRPKSAFGFSLRADGAKYDKVLECLVKDCDRLLSFYGLPAEN